MMHGIQDILGTAYRAFVPCSCDWPAEKISFYCNRLASVMVTSLSFPSIQVAGWLHSRVPASASPIAENASVVYRILPTEISSGTETIWSSLQS